MRTSLVTSAPPSRRSRILWPGRPWNSGLSFRRRSQTTKPSDGTVWVVAETVTTCSRDSSISSPGLVGSSVQGSRPAVHPAQQPQHAAPSARRRPRAGRSSAAPSSSSAAGATYTGRAIRWSMWVCETNQVGVPMNDHGCAPRSKPSFNSGNPPIRLHRRPRVALDREVLVDERLDGQVVDHRVGSR